MKVTDYIGILFQEKDFPHSEYVDKLLTQIMQAGLLTGVNDNWIRVHFGASDYAFWAGDKWWGDLSKATRDGKYLYSDKRPSRLVQIKFWRWVERNGLSRDDREWWHGFAPAF